MGNNAYEAAKAGGKHAGWLAEYSRLPDNLLAKAARSIQKQIDAHESWIENPALKLGEDHGLPAKSVEEYRTLKWPKDIERQREHLDILNGILGSRNGR